MTTTLVRIPRRFYDDHDGRALPSPVVVKATARHYWIDRCDAHVQELVDDARHYVDRDAQDHDFGARALLRALDSTERNSTP